MVLVENVSKSFKSRKKGKIEAVKNVSFTAESGKIYGLLGPNGAGKTTTMRMISTLLKPDSGKITVGGIDVQKDPQKVRSVISFLTGEMRISGNLTGYELMKFFGELNKLPKEKINDRINYLVEKLDMKDFIDRPAVKLSTGMKQKVSISISLMNDPEVIIFDEPTNGLDIFSARVVTDFLKDMREQRKTIIISTHIMSLVEKICDNIGIIFKGELVENAPLDEILRKHSTKELEDVFFKYAEYYGESEQMVGGKK